MSTTVKTCHKCKRTIKQDKTPALEFYRGYCKPCNKEIEDYEVSKSEATQSQAIAIKPAHPAYAQ